MVGCFTLAFACMYWCLYSLLNIAHDMSRECRSVESFVFTNPASQFDLSSLEARNKFNTCYSITVYVSCKAHSRKRRTSNKSLTQSFDALRSSKWRLSSWTFSFCGRRRFSEVSHPQQYSIATRDTVFPMNIEVPTKYLLSHNDRIVVLEIRLHSESPMLYRPALYGNWNALSLARRGLKDKFPHANGSTHSRVAKSSGISAESCISVKKLRVAL